MNRLSLLLFTALLLPDLAGCSREPATQGADDLRAGDAGQSQETSGTAAGPLSAWRAGVHYDVLEPVQGAIGTAGKVQVIEFFWYACVHCYAIEPHLQEWDRARPEYIEFVRVPAQGRPVSRAHARLYYALETLGRSDLHARVFEAIHLRGNELFAADEAETLRLHVAFAQAHAISPDSFKIAYRSAAVEAALRRADQLLRRYKILGVPAIIVNGRYQTGPTSVEDPRDLFALVNELAARERSRAEHIAVARRKSQ